MRFFYFWVVFLSTLSANSLAEEIDRYRVELILFTQLSVQGEDEAWPENPPQPATSQAQPLMLESALTPVSEKTADMTAILYTLKQSSLYQPLLHAAWEQPGWTEDAAQPIRIEVPFNARLPVTIFSENAVVATRQPSALLSDQPQLPGYLRAELNQELPPSMKLEGTLTIHRARYLHAAFDLIYREYIDVEVSRTVMQSTDPAFEPIEVVDKTTQLVEMPFHQTRRMRSNERHYIDHPRVGALIQITPIEKEEMPETTLEESTQVIPESN